MKGFDYTQIVSQLRERGKRRESAFIRKKYIECKSMKEIGEEMYLNSRSAVFMIGKRCKRLLLQQYGVNLFLSDDDK